MDKCPECGGDLKCLAGHSGHPRNWYCEDENSCGWQAWGYDNPAPSPEPPKLVTGLPTGETFVAMCVHDRDLYVATNKDIYRLIDDKLVKLELTYEN